jgi:hypothetical protein
MSIYSQIRAALELRLSTTPNLPTIQYDNTRLDPTSGVPYLICSFIPTSRRPAEVGSNPFHLYQGLFSISVATPEKVGSGDNQDICDRIIAAFPSGTHGIVFNNRLVRIDYTEQLGSFRDSPWFITPINVGWNCYDKD